jgi:hypothetical protein
LIVTPYRLAYEVDGQTVTVLSVMHGAMDVEARLRERFGTD